MRGRSRSFWVISSVVAVFGCLALLMVLFPGMWLTPDMREANGRLPQVKERLRQAGIALDLSALAERNVPDEQNAAVEFARIVQKHGTDVTRAAQSNRSPRNLLQGDLSPANQAKARELVSSFSVALDELVAATLRPKCVFARNWKLGRAVTFPEYGPLVQLSRLLCCRAMMRGASGDLVSMRRELKAAWGVGAHIGSEPAAISSIVQARIQQLVLRAIMSLAVYESIGPATLADLSALLGALTWKLDYGPSLAVHAAMYSATVNDPAFGQTPEVPFPQELKRDTVHRRAYECRVLELVLDVNRVWSQDEGDPVSMYRHTVEVVGELAAKPGASYDYAQQVGGWLASQPMSGVEQLVRFRMARQAIQLGQYRMRTHSWPSTLGEAGAPQLDPFDGQPLRYERTDVGFALRSRCVDLPTPRAVEGDTMIARNPRSFEFVVPAANVDERL